MDDKVTNVRTPPVSVPASSWSGMLTTYAVDNTPRYAVPAGDPPFTLRDHFAGLAMQAIIAKFPAELVETDLTPSKEEMDTARGAYVYADAMLAARKAQP